jgi:hypothetical protein
MKIIVHLFRKKRSKPTSGRIDRTPSPTTRTHLDSGTPRRSGQDTATRRRRRWQPFGGPSPSSGAPGPPPTSPALLSVFHDHAMAILTTRNMLAKPATDPTPNLTGRGPTTASRPAAGRRPGSTRPVASAARCHTIAAVQGRHTAASHLSHTTSDFDQSTRGKQPAGDPGNLQPITITTHRQDTQ